VQGAPTLQQLASVAPYQALVDAVHSRRHASGDNFVEARGGLPEPGRHDDAMLEPTGLTIPSGALLVFGLALSSSVVLLYLLGQRDEQQLRRDWDLLLSPKGERLYRNREGRQPHEMALATTAFDEAFMARELTLIVRELGSLELLGAMAAFSRMVSALVPVAPLRPGELRLSRISSLTRRNGLLHQLLVSTARRFGLELYLLVRSSDRAFRFLRHLTAHWVEGGPHGEHESGRVRAIRDDFQTTPEGSLAELKQLLASLVSEDADEDPNGFDRSAS
jgi:hypothetical protein